MILVFYAICFLFFGGFIIIYASIYLMAFLMSKKILLTHGDMTTATIIQYETKVIGVMSKLSGFVSASDGIKNEA
jgi:hypothetical protein